MTRQRVRDTSGECRPLFSTRLIQIISSGIFVQILILLIQSCYNFAHAVTLPFSTQELINIWWHTMSVFQQWLVTCSTPSHLLELMLTPCQSAPLEQTSVKLYSKWIKENVFQNAVHKMFPIMCRPQYVNDVVNGICAICFPGPWSPCGVTYEREVWIPTEFGITSSTSSSKLWYGEFIIMPV